MFYFHFYVEFKLKKKNLHYTFDFISLNDPWVSSSYHFKYKQHFEYIFLILPKDNSYTFK